ncbi:MAG: AIR synthase family protein [Candidatus Hadarchaeota archaeon]
MVPLPTGKVSAYELAKIIFPQLEADDERVLIGPGVGIDSSVIEIEEGVLVLASDPITGALTSPGKLVVNVNANDVACMGASPEWFLLNLFLPEGSEKSDMESIMSQATSACKGLGVTIVGGHTEVTPGLDRTLLSGAMVGVARKDEWVSSAGAKPGDRILLTKSVAIEGTYIMAMDREKELSNSLDSEIVEEAKKFLDRLSVVDEALKAISVGGVNAMHDPTEGGLVGGLHELADASNVGFSIDRDRIPVAYETGKICEYLGIDPLLTIASGSLLISVDPEMADELRKALLESGIEISDIGEILRRSEKRVMNGKKLEYPKQDELWRVF